MARLCVRIRPQEDGVPNPQIMHINCVSKKDSDNHHSISVGGFTVTTLVIVIQMRKLRLQEGNDLPKTTWFC